MPAARALEALKRAGCQRVYTEAASGGRWERPELHKLLDQLRDGDVVMVWKLDRLSRSLRDMLTILDRINEAKAGFVSMTEAINTTSPAGRMMMQMLGAFAEFEREMIRERTKAGLEAARKQGRIGGRRPKLSKAQRQEALKMLDAGRSQADVARLFKVSPSTICRLASSHRTSQPN